MDEEQPLTPIEQSRADTGFRHYVVQPDTYTTLAAKVDQSRGYPNKQGTTLTGLPSVEQLADATDGSGKLIAIDCWRFTEADDQMLEEPLNDGSVEELTAEEWAALLPVEEEV